MQPDTYPRKTEGGPLVLGASGKVGKLLYSLWVKGLWQINGTPVWQYRSVPNDIRAAGHRVWESEINHSVVPPDGIGSVICLAGIVAGSQDELQFNTDIALSAKEIARKAGNVPLLVASSQAVYGSGVCAMSEDTSCAPLSPYGISKFNMERELRSYDKTCCLRLGNIAGADQLFSSIEKGHVVMDKFLNGEGPQRAYIGPRYFCDVLANLLMQRELPPVLNVAEPGLKRMEDILSYLGTRWTWRKASSDALYRLELDLSLLDSLISLRSTTVADLICDLKNAGWEYDATI